MSDQTGHCWINVGQPDPVASGSGPWELSQPDSDDGSQTDSKYVSREPHPGYSVSGSQSRLGALWGSESKHRVPGL